MIRVVLAEDQAMVLGALGALLEMEADLQVVGKAQNGNDALTLVFKLDPDVVVTDIEMPGRTGLDLARELKQQGKRTGVIILTTFARPRLPAPRSRRRRQRLPPEGRSLPPPRRGHPPGPRRRSRRRPRARRRGLVRGGSVDGPRAAGVAPRQRGTVDGGHCRRPKAVGGHGAELLVGGNQQAGREEPRGGGARGEGEGVVVRAAGLLRVSAGAPLPRSRRWRPNVDVGSPLQGADPVQGSPARALDRGH